MDLMAGPVRSKEIEILKARTDAMQKRGVTPTLKVILVGDMKASLIYTRSKKKFIENFGASCEIIHLPSSINEAEFLAEVGNVVGDDSVHGLFVQLPLPKHLSHIDVGDLIPGHKDVDGFNQKNIYELFKGDRGDKALLPCTPKGIITLLHHYNIGLDGKNVVILGRSEIVGRPMALLLLNHNATVTVCHSKTQNIKAITGNADIIISAIGRAKFLDRSFLGDKKPVIVDVGINHDDAGKLCGDVNYDDVKDLCSAISPVPGGVGPMTILSLAQNLLQATEMSL
ncbi:MAG: bifunctional methylenetetrahydrofolate dehydrogenase/methenyltetrahydrofolate cyclohydrolase [Deltaproteobacteria bacterium]|nr:MAG: bifunctional methylenetetrahydrofolate dehydrogenase/methenyltetrahydrofolate cyclohydrolase [Deltaproteobacteria bacterium]